MQINISAPLILKHVLVQIHPHLYAAEFDAFLLQTQPLIHTMVQHRADSAARAHNALPRN